MCGKQIGYFLQKFDPNTHCGSGGLGAFSLHLNSRTKGEDMASTINLGPPPHPVSSAAVRYKSVDMLFIH